MSEATSGERKRHRPGFAPLIRATAAASLLRQTLLELRPALVRLAQKALGIGGKGIPVFLAAEQIKPLSRDQPEPGVAGERDAAGQIGRVVAAEPGAVNIGMGNKGSAIALVAETPDRP